MNCKSNKLRDAVVLALVVGVGGTGTAIAQEAGGATNLDKIEVTGSRIRQVDSETAQPVMLISRDQIEKQGFKSVADILQNIPTAGSPAISRTSPLSSGENVGGYYIDLRNLGANRTLILVDGHRLGITNGGLQDVASIPAVMVERIEVLKDGASTIYGSDAIAGVINIITRKDFEGAEANVYIGQWGQGDGQREVYDFTMGFRGDRGSLTAGVEYTNEDPVWARDRWFSRNRFPTGEKTDPRPGGLSGTTEFGRLAYRNAAGGTSTATLRRDVAGLDPADFSSYRPLNGTDTSNPSLASTVYSGIKRKSAFLNGHFDFTDNVAFDTSVLYTDRESFAQNAGYPMQSAAFDLSSGGLSVDSVFNPLGNQASGALPPGVAPQSVQYVRRGWEVPREVMNNLTTSRFTGKFSGSFNFGEKYWDWEAGFLYNQNKGTQISTGNLNTFAVGQATGPSFINADGVAQCGTAGASIPLGSGPGACTPWNPLVPFGYNAPNGLSDPNVQAYLYQPGQALSETTTKNYFASVAGVLATLPAGDLGVAFGVERREESGSFSPDALAQTGISTDLAAGPTRGGYNLNEIYAELQVPLLADLPGAQELSVTLASRYSDYDTFGNTTNSKFGFKWKPIESLWYAARGRRVSAHRPLRTCLAACRKVSKITLTHAIPRSVPQQATPAAWQMFRLASVSSTHRALLRRRVQANSRTCRSFLAVRQPLTPETSTSKTLGLVWSPGFLNGLNASLDWWNIRIENTIVADTPTDLLDDCYLRGLESRCVGFTRNAAGNVSELSFGLRNAGYVETEGFDFDLTYRFETQWGNFTTSLLNTYVSKNELKADNTDNPPSQQNGFGGNFRVRSNLSVNWQWDDWSVTWSTRYFSRTKERCFADDRCSLPNFSAPEFQGSIVGMNELGSNTFHDLQVAYVLPWNATVAVGANNIFEHYSAPAYGQPIPAIPITAGMTSVVSCT